MQGQNLDPGYILLKKVESKTYHNGNFSMEKLEEVLWGSGR